MGGVVEIVTRVWARQLRKCGMIFTRAKKFISSPKHLNGLWGPPILLFNGYET